MAEEERKPIPIGYASQERPPLFMMHWGGWVLLVAGAIVALLLVLS
jgi:hypothetical protein